MRLYKRANGVWYVGLSRLKHRSLGTRDEKTAKAIFREIEKETLKGKLLSLEGFNRIRLSDFTERYKKTRAGKSKWTIKADMLALKFLKDAIGDVMMETIDRTKIDRFKEVCTARGVKPVSVNGYLRHIKAAMRYAEEEGFIKKVPKIVMLPPGKKLPRILSPDEIKSLLQNAMPELERYIVFFLWTGARRSEAVNLDYEDVHGDEAILRGKGDRERLVPLLDEARGAIGTGEGKVFAQWHPDTLSKLFHALTLECGIKARLHDLRHSAVTYMIMSGIDMATVQKIVGHASISTTEGYTHVISEHMKSEMGKLRFG